MFSQTMLIHADTKEPIGPVYYNNREMMPLVGDRTVFAQRAYGASDAEDNVPEYKAVFAFSDLSVRQEGRYCLQMDMYEIVGDDRDDRGIKKERYQNAIQKINSDKQQNEAGS